MSHIRNMRMIVSTGIFLMATSFLAAGNAHEKEVKTKAGECSPDLAVRKQPANEISIVTAEQLLLKLREIHENFLLLDKAFINEKNLKTTFGLTQRYYPPPLDIPEDLDFRIQPARSGLLQTDLHFSTAVFYRDKPRSRASYIYVRPYDDSNSYAADLVERTIAKDIVGRDLLREAALGLSDVRVSHAIENFSLRPPALHPKGYLEYRDVFENEYCKSTLSVSLDRAGKVFSIDISQKER
ncbi:hypothetical protein Hrubri_3473 [Herbaspirillum rubrisubalbicans M1]|nr:hypothetical protein Hrubri_3473 [Herbaspirillum rubrisubalbicans M1]